MKYSLPSVPVMVAATVVAAGLLLSAKPANAQTPINPLLPTANTKEISLSGNIIFDPDSSQDINVGYGYFFNRNLQAGASFRYVNPDQTDSQYEASAFANYHFPTASPLLPFVGVTVGVIDPGENNSDSFVYGVQGGVKYFLNQNVSANAQLVFREYDEKSFENDFRLNFGLSIYLR